MGSDLQHIPQLSPGLGLPTAVSVNPTHPPYVRRDALTGLFRHFTHLITYLFHLISQRV